MLMEPSRPNCEDRSGNQERRRSRARAQTVARPGCGPAPGPRLRRRSPLHRATKRKREAINDLREHPSLSIQAAVTKQRRRGKT
ncbi:hypothetical protein GN956_G2562 [Arapaima gigas]